jgi:hypothetical protein
LENIASLYITSLEGLVYYINFSQILKVYGCETWSLTLEEEHWLKVLENRVLRNILGLVG